MLADSTLAEAASLLAACRTKNIMLATAESCTGGLIAAALTSIAGSSDVVDRGFVTYSNDAKIQMIGVSPALIQTHGAVSEEVARAMADGAPQPFPRRHCHRGDRSSRSGRRQRRQAGRTGVVRTGPNRSARDQSAAGISGRSHGCPRRHRRTRIGNDPPGL